MTWAFEQYATGTWSLHQLAKELGKRGLTQRHSATKPYEPISKNTLNQAFARRYYIGYVTYMGVEYVGKHKPLIDQETFDKVQRIMKEHRVTSERPSRHYQYLIGSVFCARCHASLGFTLAKGLYPYLFCHSRHAKILPCTLPYLKLQDVEDAVSALYHIEPLTELEFKGLVVGLKEDLPAMDLKADQSRHDLQTLIDKLNKERYAWAEKVMEGLVPNDIAREKQSQLAAELTHASSQLKRLDVTTDKREKLLMQAIKDARRSEESYQDSQPHLKRQWNQSLWDRIELDADGTGGVPSIAKIQRTILFEGIQFIRRNNSETINIRQVVDEILKNRHIDAGDLSDVPTIGSNFELLAGAREWEYNFFR